jgi:hypothetical protein
MISLDNEKQIFTSNSNKIEINALGFCGKIPSQRNSQDGYNFFGVDVNKKDRNYSPIKSPKRISQTDFFKGNRIGEFFQKRMSDEIEQSINDYDLPLDPIETNFINCSKRLFVINYDTDIMKYRIKDLLSEVPIFYKVQNETVLADNSVINIGDTYVYVSFGALDHELFEMDSEENSGNKIFSAHSIGANGMSNNNLINLKIFNKFGVLIQDPM